MVSKFNQEVLHNKPPIDIMRAEVRMHTLKIRPHAGDVFHLNMGNDQFIGALWSILKLDEYVQKSAKYLRRNEIPTFFHLMAQYREKLQDQINAVDMRLPHVKKQKGENLVTIEIFRDIVGKGHKRKA